MKNAEAGKQRVVEQDVEGGPQRQLAPQDVWVTGEQHNVPTQHPVFSGSGAYTHLHLQQAMEHRHSEEQMVQGQAHEHHLKTADTRAEMQEQIGSHMYAPQQSQTTKFQPQVQQQPQLQVQQQPQLQVQQQPQRQVEQQSPREMEHKLQGQVQQHFAPQQRVPQQHASMFHPEVLSCMIPPVQQVEQQQHQQTLSPNPTITGTVEAKNRYERLPVRAYLDQTVVPLIVAGLVELVKVRPADPVYWLAQYLLNHNPQKPYSQP